MFSSSGTFSNNSNKEDLEKGNTKSDDKFEFDKTACKLKGGSSSSDC